MLRGLGYSPTCVVAVDCDVEKHPRVLGGDSFTHPRYLYRGGTRSGKELGRLWVRWMTEARSAFQPVLGLQFPARRNRTQRESLRLEWTAANRMHIKVSDQFKLVDCTKLTSLCPAVSESELFRLRRVRPFPGSPTVQHTNNTQTRAPADPRIQILPR